MKKFFWSLLFLILTLTNPIFAAEEKTTLRVGVSNSSFSSYEHSSLDFILEKNSNITDMQGEINKTFEDDIEVSVQIENGIFKININQEDPIEMKGPIAITSSGKIGIKNIKRRSMPAYYTGMLELVATRKDKFNLINVLDMQNYLKGVVPNEMPVSFGLEALKAQAVAARNYASRPIKVAKNYDICDSTACQVYYGLNGKSAISDRAVDETLGIYALYNNDIILTLYSSTAGGITEDYINTFGNFIEDKPYLKSVLDVENLDKMKDEDFFKNAPPSFDMNSPKYRWTVTFDRFELEDTLSQTLPSQTKTGCVHPEFTSEDKISGLEDIKILKRGTSKKALEIEIKAQSGNYIVKKELAIRRIFKFGNSILPSANFIVEKKYHKTTEEEPKEEVIFKDETKTLEGDDDKKIYRTKLGKKLPSEFVFYGAGFGHGVGMSQYGAGFLSSYGVSYENILKHYYKGISLGTIPKTVSYNPYGINYSQEFYFSKKSPHTKSGNISKSPLKKELTALLNKQISQKCFLIIENTDNVSNVEFFINGYYFNPSIKGRKRILKTDITEYLSEGKNKITFNPLCEADKKKTVKFYITLGEDND